MESSSVFERKLRTGYINAKQLRFTGICYCDSDWGASPLSRCSLISSLVTLGGSPISWKTKKQGTVFRSSIEAECCAMGTVTSELIGIKSFLAAMGVFHTTPLKLFCDNQAALHIAKNLVFSRKGQAYRDGLSFCAQTITFR